MAGKYRKATATTAFVGAAVLMILCGTTPVFAGNGGSGQRMEGTWLVTITVKEGLPVLPPPFLALDTFDSNGGLIAEYNLPPLPLAGLLISSSSAQGEWVRTGDRTFATTVLAFLFNQNRAPVGLFRFNRTIELAATLDSFTAVFVGEVLDGNLNVLTSFSGTAVATRIDIGGLPPGAK
jgi:hypothetical protein